ncbi:hypothetical protein NFI96_027394 [Prochilodus magdalenae]|nr:hypothetical protein NFI96_027394 [Prochilodus magdalenae]
MGGAKLLSYTWPGGCTCFCGAWGEQETLSFIRENLEKSDQLTKGMVSILSSFESRLMALENSIIPVHKQTENLQRLQENVEKTLSCLDHVISYYHVAKDTDKIIKEGPTGRLDEYLACIAKIQKAVEYFQDNNPDSPELNTVKVRFEKGKEQLEAEFRALLTRYSKPVPPILILDAIGGDEELEGEVTLEHLPEAVLQDIICISAWLVEYGRNQDFMNVYFQIRSSQLDRSIKGLKEHFRKSSASSALLYSPAVQAKRKDTPTKKAPKRPAPLGDSLDSVQRLSSSVARNNILFSSLLLFLFTCSHVDSLHSRSLSVVCVCVCEWTIRKAQNLLKQYSQHGLDGKKASNLTPLEGYDHEPRGVKHLSEALSDKHGASTGKDDVLDVEIDSYIHCISAFVKLAQSEYALLTEIIPEHHQKKTFDSLIQEALDNLMLDGDSIVTAARRAIMRHDYSAVLTIFPILRHLKQTKPDFDSTLQGTAASTKNKLPTLITSMETTGAKALEEFADSIKNDPDKEYNMPKDGTVHELTSNAILFLQQLLDFQETAGAMLASQGKATLNTVTTAVRSFISGHRTLSTGRCPQDAAHRTLPTGGCRTGGCPTGGCRTGGCPTGGCRTGRCPQDAAHRTPPTGRRPTGRCPTGRCPTGRCPQDAAHRTPPHRTLPHRTLPHRTLPHRTLPYRTLPHRTLPHRTLPYRTLSHRTLPYRTLPYRTQPTGRRRLIGILGDTYNIPLDPRETSSSASSYSSEFSRRLLSTYICKVLGNLQLNLLSKSKVYEDLALSAIFLHNNYNYILKSLEKSELIQLVAVTQKKAESSYRELIEQQILIYQRSWVKVTDHLTDRNMPAPQPGNKLKDKERQVIKDKFKGFNDGLEELCKIQKVWAIPDKGQRDTIRQAQRRLVSDAYRAFLQRNMAVVVSAGGRAAPVWIRSSFSDDDDVAKYRIDVFFQNYLAFLALVHAHTRQREPPNTPTGDLGATCANIAFTKNPEKYHKYSPEQVEEMIEKLFDTSA